MKEPTPAIHILMADDDGDDCLLFKDAVEECHPAVQVTFVSNGVDLLRELKSHSALSQVPDLLFLDLNMPLKNGMDCLLEIKSDRQLARIPVIIFSTSAQRETVSMAYKNGAYLYVKKPDSFPKLKELIRKVLSITTTKGLSRVPEENFFLDQ